MVSYTVSNDFTRPNMNTVLIDFDGVASRNPTYFRKLGESFIKLEMDYLIFTSRSVFDLTNHEIYDFFPKSKIVFCEGETKKRVAEALEIDIAFWIDDHPEDIVDINDIFQRNEGE